MQHPRYLRVGGRPIFKVLIPQIFVSVECAGNTTLANARIKELQAMATLAGLPTPLIGGGWQSPSMPAVPQSTARPHPNGYMQYNYTTINGSAGAVLKRVKATDVRQCALFCNTTAECAAFTIDMVPHAVDGDCNCTLLSNAGPGIPSKYDATYVRVLDDVHWDFTGTYNDAPPICKDRCSCCECRCSRYTDSWFPNATAAGAKTFPYSDVGDYQGQARLNHSNDTVPYVPNVIAGFDPRPWEEPAPSFLPPSLRQWEAALVEVKAQCQDPKNHFGFPDPSKPGGVQPAVEIYAWNEYGEGGLLAPTRGFGDNLLQGVAKVFRAA